MYVQMCLFDKDSEIRPRPGGAMQGEHMVNYHMI